MLEPADRNGWREKLPKVTIIKMSTNPQKYICVGMIKLLSKMWGRATFHRTWLSPLQFLFIFFQNPNATHLPWHLEMISLRKFFHSNCRRIRLPVRDALILRSAWYSVTSSSSWYWVTSSWPILSCNPFNFFSYDFQAKYIHKRVWNPTNRVQDHPDMLKKSWHILRRRKHKYQVCHHGK